MKGQLMVNTCLRGIPALRKNLLLFIGAVSLLAFSSCTEKNEYAPPVFPEEKELQSVRLSADGLMVSYPYDVCVDDAYIYVLSLVDNTWIQVYDKKDGSFIGGYVSRGQGPGEVIMGTFLSYDEESRTLTVYDEAFKKLLSYQTGGSREELLSFLREKSLSEQEGVIRRAWELSEGTCLIDGQLGEGAGEQKRFQLLKENRVTSTYNSFPTDSPDEQMVYLLNASVVVSPDRTKMAVGTMYGGVLEVFDLTGNAIKEVAARRFYPPVVHYEPGIIRNTPETVYGFSHLYATDRYIYSVLIGGKDPNRFDTVAVFDWKGCEVVSYHTDCLVFKLCQSVREPNKLYAVAFSQEEGFYLVYFQLA